MKILSLGCLVCLAGTALAQVASPSVERATKPPPKPAFSVNLAREKVPHAGEITRGLIQGETNQVSFVLPRGFRSQTDPARKKITLVAEDGGAIITITLREPVADPKGEIKDAGKFRDALQQASGGAKLTDEFTASSAMASGIGFEFTLPGRDDSMITRAMYYPLARGIVEVVINSPLRKIRAHEDDLNRLVLSLRSAGPENDPRVRPYPNVN